MHSDLSERVVHLGNNQVKLYDIGQYTRDSDTGLTYATPAQKAIDDHCISAVALFTCSREHSLKIVC